MSSASTFLAHSDLKPPVSDEWNMGLTQAMSDNFAFDVTWIHKFARGFWEDDEVNQRVDFDRLAFHKELEFDPTHCDHVFGGG